MFRSEVNHFFYGQTSTAGSKMGHEKVLRMAVTTFALLSISHLIIGANPVVVTIAFMIMMIGIIPVTVTGIRRIGALFVLFVGFRYVDFAVLVKFLMLQPLDSNLDRAIEAFFVVLLGLAGYLVAFFISTLVFVRRPLLKPDMQERKLLIISILGAIVGGAAWLGKIAAVNNLAEGADIAQTTTVYAFFTSFYLLAIIAATARILITSNGRRSINVCCVVLLFTQLAFGLIANSRMTILNGILAYIVTVIAFQGKIRWRYVALVGVVLACIISFVTPVMLYVRGSRAQLSAWERIVSTVEIAKLAVSNAQVHKALRERVKDSQSFLNYYGEPMNVLDRASLIQHVDVIIDGIDNSEYKGFKSIKIGIGRLLPRFMNPKKDVGWSLGDKLYYEIGIRTTLGGYSTVPLIADGYASFGWLGAFVFPIVFATPIFVILRKIGWSMTCNIWAIYLFLRFHDSFVEGDSIANLLTLFRYLPQDLLILLLINYASTRLSRSHLKKKVENLSSPNLSMDR